MPTITKHQPLIQRLVKYILPNPGTLLLLLLFLWVQNTGAAPWLAPVAAPSSATTINYQGRLFNSGGSPLDASVNLEFALYSQASGGSPMWGPETHSGVTVSDGLFSVLLGNQVAIPLSVIGGDLWLETKVNGEVLSPREQLGATMYAMQALTVPDGSITTTKIADGAVTKFKAPYLLASQWDNRVVVIATWTGDLDANGMATIDISPFDFLYVDSVVVVNGDDSAVPNTTINVYEWGGTAYFKIRAWRNGAIVPNAHIRFNYGIMAKR